MTDNVLKQNFSAFLIWAASLTIVIISVFIFEEIVSFGMATFIGIFAIIVWYVFLIIVSFVATLDQYYDSILKLVVYNIFWPFMWGYFVITGNAP
jgi:hypothetical protein